MNEFGRDFTRGTSMPLPGGGERQMPFRLTSDRYIVEIAKRAERCLFARWPGLVLPNRVLLFGIRQGQAEHLWLGCGAEQYDRVITYLRRRRFHVKRDLRFRYSLGLRLDVREDIAAATALSLFVLLGCNDQIVELRSTEPRR